MSGNDLFWSSGTWLLFLAQGGVLLGIFALYLYMGYKEKEVAKNTATKRRQG